MPANIKKRRMAIPMQAAENIDMKETWFNVLGRDITMPISVTITLKTTVQSE